MNKTKTLKKVLSMALVLMMVLSTMVIMPLTASALEGDGSAENPFKVASRADLQAVKDAATSFMNQELYVVLTADIDMGTTAFDLSGGSYPNASNLGAVKYQIDGQGHTISNTNTQLLYGTIGGVTIKNLNIVMNQTNGEAYGAAFIGVVCGNANGEVLIENCTASGTLNYKRGGTRTAGGFVGNIYSGTPTLTIRNCVNNATIYNSDSAAQPFGGMLGGCEDNGVVVIENCVNNGAITAKAGWVGGMLGRYKSATSITIDNCINNGVLTNTNTHVGGMVGFCDTTSPKITITNCYTMGGEVENAILTGDTTNAPVITNDNTLDEVRAMITMPRKDGTALADLEAWDGTTTTAPSLQNPDAANSAANPYLIGTAAELAYLSTTVLSYVKLTDNIDMGGHSFGGLKNGSFTFDGDNYTIHNVFVKQYSAGFICSATAAQTITLSNVHFAGLKSAGGSGAGGMMAYVHSTGSYTFTNVTMDANSVVGCNRAKGNTTGGFIGDDYGSKNAKVTIDRCIMAAAVFNTKGSTESGYGSTWVGGFFGGFEGATTADNIVVTNSIVEGAITTYLTGTANAEQKQYTGVLIGQGGAAYAWDNVYVVAGLTAAGVSGQSLPSITLNTNYSASFAASDAFKDEIEEIASMGVSLDAPAVMATRMKLTDDFGFMAMTQVPVIDTFNPHVNADSVGYGMLVLKASTATADELLEKGTFVEAETYLAADGMICAQYTDISVATMNADYVYAFCILVNGAIVGVCEDVCTINCYEWSVDLAPDGMLGDQLVTENTQEKALYGAMANYYEKYAAYLTYVNEQNAQ